MADASISLSRSLATKIAANLKIPYTIIDKHEKFPEPKNLSRSLSDSKQLLLTLEAESAQKPNHPWAQEFATSVGEIRSLFNDIDTSRSKAKEKNLDWEGPSAKETDEFRAFGDWGAELHAAWVKIVLHTRPTIALASPYSDIKNFDVLVSVTGELWAKHPWFKCVKKKWGICYKWKKVIKWTRIASATVRNFAVDSDIRIQFLVDNLDTLGEPRFTRLRIDYPIIKLLELKDIANKLLRDEDDKGRFSVISNEDLELGLLGTEWTPSIVKLPPNPQALSLEVDFARKGAAFAKRGRRATRKK